MASQELCHLDPGQRGNRGAPLLEPDPGRGARWPAGLSPNRVELLPASPPAEGHRGSGAGAPTTYDRTSQRVVHRSTGPGAGTPSALLSRQRDRTPGERMDGWMDGMINFLLYHRIVKGI